jgi:hypothetical protein
LSDALVVRVVVDATLLGVDDGVDSDDAGVVGAD